MGMLKYTKGNVQVEIKILINVEKIKTYKVMFEVAQIYCIEHMRDVFEISDNVLTKSYFSSYQFGFHSEIYYIGIKDGSLSSMRKECNKLCHPIVEK